MPPTSGQATRVGICVHTGYITSRSRDPTFTNGARSVRVTSNERKWSEAQNEGHVRHGPYPLHVERQPRVADPLGSG